MHVFTKLACVYSFPSMIVIIKTAQFKFFHVLFQLSPIEFTQARVIVYFFLSSNTLDVYVRIGLRCYRLWLN